MICSGIGFIFIGLKCSQGIAYPQINPVVQYQVDNSLLTRDILIGAHLKKEHTAGFVTLWVSKKKNTASYVIDS